MLPIGGIHMRGVKDIQAVCEAFANGRGLMHGRRACCPLSTADSSVTIQL